MIDVRRTYDAPSNHSHHVVFVFSKLKINWQSAEISLGAAIYVMHMSTGGFEVQLGDRAARTSIHPLSIIYETTTVSETPMHDGGYAETNR
jgi:hypothetical protein